MNQQWITFKEQKPPLGKILLKYENLIWIGLAWQSHPDTDEVKGPVATHWMPLPEPPKE